MKLRPMQRFALTAEQKVEIRSKPGTQVHTPQIPPPPQPALKMLPRRASYLLLNAEQVSLTAATLT